MISKTQLSYNLLCEQCFLTLEPLNKWRKDFIKDVLWLFLSIYGRINFSQLGRYGNYCEQRYRQQFEEPFEFMNFNAAIVKQYCSERRVIAFDPSYIPKSGKQTPGIGKFWSGCAGSVKWGLEISGIAAIDLENHTAIHLEAVQTIPDKQITLIDYYAELLTDRAKDLLKLSDTVVCDAYFSKKPFVTKLVSAGLHVVSRFRDDVRLQYIIPKVMTGKRGRPKEYQGAVDLENLDMNHFSLVEQENKEVLIYQAIVKAVALKRTVKVIFVQYMDSGEVKASKIYFSTKTSLQAMEILDIYQTRFQIEFLYRDAKQFTALTTCQARDKEKLNFHFNMALTAVNAAKVVHWFAIPIEQRKAFSMADIKTINHNALLLDRFIAMFAIKPNILKNNQNVKELLLYGTSAA